MSQTYAPSQSQQYRQSHTASQSGDGQRANAQRSGAPSGPVGRQFPTRSDLPEQVRTSSIGILNQCLADLTAVNMQLKDAHWNVKGIHFYQLHELFEDLSESFEPHIDEVAERASALGGEPLGTARDVARTTTIPPVERGAVDGQSVLSDLAHRLSILDASLHQGIQTADRNDDLDTADLLNEVSRDVSKALWFVEAHLQGPTGGGMQTGGTGQAQGGTGFQSASFGGSPDSQRSSGARH